MKKAVILSVLMCCSLVFATEQKCAVSSTSKSCGGCPGKAKATTAATTDGCPIHAQGAVALAQADSVKPAPAKETPVAVENKIKQSDVVAPVAEPAKPLDPAGAKEAVAPKEAGKEELTCSSAQVKCKELNMFHAAMHPMAVAVGFEGDGKKDYAAVRAAYPNMKEKTELVAKMVCDSSCTKDVKAFEEKRSALIKHVDKLGETLKGTDTAKIDAAFENVHQGYIDLAMLAK